MKMYNKQQKVSLWGNHIDPEVSAEKYLYHSDEVTKDWAKENEDTLQQLDRDTINLYRRHENNCDFRNVEYITEKRKKKESTLTAQKGRLPKDPTDRWIDQIYSKDPQDLHQLVSDEKISAALKDLTDRQKQIVHMSAIKRMKNTEIAKILEITDRGVRDTLQRAYERIRIAVGNNKGAASADVIGFTLLTTILPTFWVAWYIVNKTYAKIKRLFTKIPA